MSDEALVKMSCQGGREGAGVFDLGLAVAAAAAAAAAAGGGVGQRTSYVCEQNLLAG